MKAITKILLLFPCIITMRGNITAQTVDTLLINHENSLAEKYFNEVKDDSTYILADRALNHSNQIDYNLGKAQAEYNLARYYSAKSRFDKSISLFFSAKEKFDTEKDLKSVSECETQIGIIYYLQKNYQDAYTYFQNSLEHSEQRNDPLLYYLSGLSLIETGDYNMAEVNLQKAFKLYDSLERYKNSSESLVGLGDLYVKTKQYAKAEEHYEKALRWFANQAEEVEGIAIATLGLGNVRNETGHKDEAIKLISRAYRLADSVGFYIVAEKAALQLSKLFREKQDYRQAYKYQDRYFAIRDSIMSADNLKAINSMESELALSKKQSEVALLSKQRQVDRLVLYATLGGVLLLLLVSAILYQRFRYERHRKNMMNTERQNSDRLLLNILPAETAAELKRDGKATARHYEEVTVMFADIKDFTRHAETLTPEDLVALIDTYFQAFDDITEKYGLEKIKTIGDAYLCAGGLPNPEKGKPADVIRCAIAMQELVDQLHVEKTRDHVPAFEIRIGIHTGPVVAGVVGTKKFAYDIWGDTVNIAARMEQNSAPGQINISHHTYEKVKDRFICTYRGRIPAKNKGEFEMYFVESEIVSPAEMN